MRFFFIIFIFFNLCANSQVWYIPRVIKYCDTQYSDFEKFITFPESDYSGALPAYTALIPWDHDYPGLKLKIEYPVFEEFLGDSLSLKNADFLGDSLNTSLSVNYASGKPFIQVTIIPFRINPVTKTIERLRSFSIRAEVARNMESKKDFSGIYSGAERSVLDSGKWYKIKVREPGIYKLSYEQISSMSVGDPSKVRIFGFGGEVLPEDYRKGEKDDLLPISIYMEKGTDGIFNQGDFILFYSPGSVKWVKDNSTEMFRHALNPYSDDSYFFVTTGNTSDFPIQDQIPANPPNQFSSTYDYRTFHEEELENMLLSGKKWFGEFFGLNEQQNFSFEIPDIDLSGKLRILTQVMAKSLDTSYFYLSYDNKTLDTIEIQKSNLSDYTSTFGYTNETKSIVEPSSGNIVLRLRYVKPEGAAKGWLDYFILNARSHLNLSRDFLEFRDLNTISPGWITEFTVGSAGSNTMIWDVSNLNRILEIKTELTGSDLKFKVATDTLREFVVFNKNGNFPSPMIQGDDIGAVVNQNLHGTGQPDMVIIAYPGFLEQAERLAGYRREKSKLDVLVLTPEKIYNEFSGGKPDISAYRNFIKMLYFRAGTDSTSIPKYLLLFGDGTFDNKGLMTNSTNYILTYQSENSLSPISSYVSDDFFGLLDPGENMITGLLDIGVGRLPVGSEEEAKIMVDKIIGYEQPDRMGDWRNSICFIGDDEDSNIHMIDADAMADYVEDNYPGFNITKIYLDAYEQVSTPAGQRYPDVNRAISEQIEKGSIILNYTGHGGIKGWAHELILDLNDIQHWKNEGRLPLFMTATCEFSRYDDHLVTSAGEYVLLNPQGGGIALLTTTRLVYSQPNRILNEKFYEIVFEKDKEGKNYRLGDIMKYTKNNAGSGINKRNFTLLGDPSMRLSYPEFHIFADSLDGIPVGSATDTLKALGEITISGYVADLDGTVKTDFTGYVYPTVYDKTIMQETLGNDGGGTRSFRLRNNILYKGKSTVINGLFTFSFVVPKDINYSFGNGKLSFYASDTLTDASGAFNEIIIGGSNDEAVIDLEGPDIGVYMDSPTFRKGGITDTDPFLYIEVNDEHGINTTGNGIGHDITAVLDGDLKNSFVLNNYYLAAVNTYTGGIIRYPLTGMEPGYHSVSVTVWDIYNNPASGSTDFVVVNSGDFIIKDLLNFPNPFSDLTRISFAHNQPGVTMEITVDIITLTGNIVATLKAEESNTGYRSQDIYWDGSGALEGESVYIYRIRAETTDGKSSVKSGKLIFIRD